MHISDLDIDDPNAIVKFISSCTDGADQPTLYQGVLLLTAVQELRLYASQWDAAGDSVDEKLLIGQRLRQGVAGLERQINL